MFVGRNEISFNIATMQEIVAYYMRNHMLSGLNNVCNVRVVDVTWNPGQRTFEVAFLPIEEKQDA